MVKSVPKLELDLSAAVMQYDLDTELSMIPLVAKRSGS